MESFVNGQRQKMSDTLKDVTPKEFMSGEYNDCRAYKYKDIEVVKQHSYLFSDRPKRHPFPHKNIHVWWELINGYAVGWNEDPGNRGWSFPVKKITKR